MSGIGAMFDQIAHRYDLLNHLFSLNIDRAWRRTLARAATPPGAARMLDCCSGTADQAVCLAGRFPDARISGVDISEEMLALGRKKIRRQGLEERIELQSGDVEDLTFPDHTFDLVSISFGLRNIIDKRRALAEIRRVMKPGAELLILEFSPAPAPLIRGVFRFYRSIVMPAIGGRLSGAPGAFRYLSTSIEGFLSNEDVEELLRKSGFDRVSHRPLSAGIAYLHSARSK